MSDEYIGSLERQLDEAKAAAAHVLQQADERARALQRIVIACGGTGMLLQPSEVVEWVERELRKARHEVSAVEKQYAEERERTSAARADRARLRKELSDFRPEEWCRDPECKDTNWGGTDRLHRRSEKCPAPWKPLSQRENDRLRAELDSKIAECEWLTVGRDNWKASTKNANQLIERIKAGEIRWDGDRWVDAKREARVKKAAKVLRDHNVTDVGSSWLARAETLDAAGMLKDVDDE